MEMSIKDLKDMFKESVKSDGRYQDGVTYNGERTMVTMTHGWVFVGDLYCENGQCTLKNAMNCRRHTTGKGWGHVAAEGKESCITDAYPGFPLRFQQSQIVFTQEVDPKKW